MTVETTAYKVCHRWDGDGKAHGSDRPFEWNGPWSYPGPCLVCKGTGVEPKRRKAMKTLSKFQGKRVVDPSALPSEWQPGEYWKDADGTWHCITPTGLLGWLKNHHVEEHEDGTISVVQGSWGSNSILVMGCSVIDGERKPNWHGCIERGVWKEF